MIYDETGRRKYLSEEELARFRAAVVALPVAERSFCETLLYTGCRLSEALQLTFRNVSTGDRVIVFRTLKKRERCHFRTVPVPVCLVNTLKEIPLRRVEPEALLWPWSRTKGWMVVKEAMRLGSIDGPQATPKGLRHSYGAIAIKSGVPLHMLKKWLGHSSIETTAIYANLVGRDEIEINSHMWMGSN